MKFESTVLLVDMRPEPDKIWIRNRLFSLGVIVLSLGLGLLVAFAGRFADGIQAGRETFAFYFGIAFGFVGLVICLRTLWKIEFCDFNRTVASFCSILPALVLIATVLTGLFSS